MENKNFNYFQLLNWLFEDRFLCKGKKRKGAPPQEAQGGGKPKPEAPAPGIDKEKEEKRKAKEKAGVKKESVKAIAQEKRENLKKEVVKLPEVRKLELDEFVKRAEDTSDNSEKNKLDLLKINPLREHTQIDAKQWDVTNLDGLSKVYKDCVDLGIISQSRDFYDSLFAILRNGIDPETNATNLKLCQDPANYKEELSAIPADGKFWGGENFVKAWEHFKWLKDNIMVAKDCQELEIASKQESLDSDPVATKVADFGRSTLSSVQKAVTEGDYATLGMYAVGAYAFYKIYQRLSGGGHGAEGGEHGKSFDWKKWLLYGTAAYAGYHFAKKAGYDPLKALGLKDIDYEIKGTPMENMRTILRSCPGLKEDDKKIDADIVLRVATVNLVTLHELRKKANTEGIHHIDPREFPDIFPDLADVPPFKMGRGEEGLKDYTGMSTTKLSTKQREYIRVAQQLYKIAFAAEKVYDATLKKYHPAYKGIPYEDALKNADRKLAKLWHLFSATEKYTVKEPETPFSREKLDSVRSQVVDLFKQHAENTSVDVESNLGGNHFQGKINDFPVVFVVDKDKVKVYLRNNYGKGYQGVPGPDASAEIPLEGGNPKEEVEKAVKAVEKRMGELIKRLQGGKKTFTDVGFVGKKWQCKVAISADIKKNFDILEDESTGFFEIYPDGNGVTLVDETGGVVLDSNEALAKQNPAAFSILSRFKDQPKFRIFAPLYKLNRLNFVDNDPSDNKFTIKIGKKGGSIEIQYDSTSKSFSFVKPDQEKELLKPGSGFTDELKDALREDDKLKHILKSWRDIVDELDEDYLFHFFKSVPDWFTKATSDYWARGIKLKDFTGSIAKNYTSQLLDAQVNLVLAKVAVAVGKAGSLEKASDEVNDIFGSALNDLTFQRDKLSGATKDKSDKGKKFSEDEFKEVITGVAASGIKSNDYKTWYKQFVDYTFLEYGEDDLRNGRAIKAKDVISVFAYYTAVCDDPDMDGADLRAGLSEDAKKVRDFIETSKKEGRPPDADESEKWEEDFKIKNTRYPNDDEVKKFERDFKKSHIDEPSDNEIANSLGIDASGISSLKEEIKAEKYRLYRDYVNYVVSKIHLKYTEGKLADTIPPPGSFWEIDSFDKWRNSPESAINKFIDTRELMKISKDYITFDEYLKLSDEEKSRYSEDEIILPREFSTLVVAPNTPEDTLLEKLLGDGSSESIKKTELEDQFYGRIKEALNQLDIEYAGHLKTGAFSNLREQLAPQYDLGMGTGGITVTRVPNKFKAHIDNMEERLNSWSGTLTRTDQERMINTTIASIFQNEILDPNHFDQYFERNTLPKWAKEKWEDFVIWLIG